MSSSNPTTIMKRTLKVIGWLLYGALSLLDIILISRFVYLFFWPDRQPPQDHWLFGSVVVGISSVLTINKWFCRSALVGVSSVLMIRGIEKCAWRRNTGTINQDGEKLIGPGPEQEEQRERLWRHALNEDKNFNDRLSFFLLFQSFLVAGVLNLYKSTFLTPGGDGYQAKAVTDGKFLTIIISIIGILICIIWMYVQVRQGFQLIILNRRIMKCAPEFNETVGQRNAGVFEWLHATTLLSYYVPALVIALWCTIIYYTPVP